MDEACSMQDLYVQDCNELMFLWYKIQLSKGHSEQHEVCIYKHIIFKICFCTLKLVGHFTKNKKKKPLLGQETLIYLKAEILNYLITYNMRATQANIQSNQFCFQVNTTKQIHTFITHFIVI